MADDLKKVLTNYDGLEITFFVESRVARIEFQSNGTWDLGDPDDVIVVLDGQPIAVESKDDRHAVAKIGDWAPYAEGPTSLMIRVAEYFDGWELGD